MTKIFDLAVASRSFSANAQLREELEARFPGVKVRYHGGAGTLVGNELVEFLKGAERAITGLELVNGELLRQVPGLKHIAKYGVGLDMLRLEEIKSSQVSLGWTPGVNKRSVSELALNFFLQLIRGSHLSAQNLRAGQWTRAKGRQLTGKTIGIVGCGHIGRDLVQLLKPYDCKILVHDIRSLDEDYWAFYRNFGLNSVNLEVLLAESDIVTLHVPKNKTTLNLIGKKEIARMQSHAFLVNTARGGLIDEKALIEALDAKAIAGAGLDVFEHEPLEGKTIPHHPHIVSTPHIGGGSEEAMLNMGRASIENLENFSDPTSYLRYQ